MSTGVGKHKMLSLGPTEPWSVREKLCLASSVMRSGDQNWVSVSRAIKPFSEPGRPPDWFSQKHCASQYSELLESTDAPKRKRGEKGEVVETIEDVIVRRLTTERIEELKRLIKDTQEKYRKLKKEVDLIQAGHLDPKLEELWADIELKRKQEEEEAAQKKRATEAAYQVRQAAKNTPKRVPSVTVRSPSMDVSQPETLQPVTDESCASPMAQGLTVFMPISEVTGPGPKESGLASMVDDSPQKKHLAPKATPPPSPLLSELLKKGSLIAASSRLVVEGDVATGLSNGSYGVELHTAATALPANQDITADAPTLSRLLESATPAQPPVSADPPKPPTVVPSAPDNLSVPKTGAAAVAEGSGAEAVMAGSSTPAEVEGKEAELVEEDTVVSVSYMAHELDLETVGDIIAIIEEKVDDPVEALDAAAVEAALSLCEDPAVSGHPLTSPWESQTFKAAEPEPIVQQSPAPTGTQSSPDPAGVQGEMEVLVEEASETEAVDEVTGGTVASAAPVTEQSQDSEVKTEGEREGEGGMEEAQQENRTLSPAVKCEGEDWVQPETVTPCLDSEDSSASAKDTKEVKEEDGGSEVDVDEGMEMKECGDGDGEGPYLSEVDPPASESEDGYGSHSQRYTTADSTASSPASSQFSMCSEDQEALQAQKIWKKAIMLVWRAAANHRYASVFLQPVSDDIAPGYHSIVHRPMDLSAIKKNIESGQIRTTAEFQRDIMLMFQNAVMYNSSDHDVYHMALEMQRDVLEQIQQFLATQLIMQTSESGIGTKSLRGREANRKQDPNEKTLSPAHKDPHLEPEPPARRKRNNSKQDTNEKDSLSMASPAFLLSLFVSIQAQDHKIFPVPSYQTQSHTFIL
ncbi:bromodomain-containing protein 8 isoform X1 [Sinocyclocheilus rhinocerous]|uniref:bromodomain-containing protein 8 isoform X1 n=1 Tax=Sinocyclocheilus rhinocerous TaxID=307959 RepID=UPI0007B8BD8C|nr:PREDICTED: bromodomain-containing protein 8-like isoform X1 [Sinocyclocheilus rhinocerous]